MQIILFSATFPDHVRLFASKFAPNANKIELQKTELSVEGIRQFYLDCKNAEHKYEVLVSLYTILTIGQSIIFCQVRRSMRPLPSKRKKKKSIGFLTTEPHNSTGIRRTGFLNG